MFKEKSGVRRWWRVVLITVVMASTDAIAFDELGKVELASAENPGPEIAGTERHFLRNGEPYSFKITSVEDGVYNGVDSTGCEFSGLDETWGPSLSWKNCGGNTGSQRISKKKGSPWPMTLKKKFTFSFTGSNAKGDTWKGYRKCKVKSAVKVRVPAGEFDTFKFTCSNEWETKTYWYSPELKHSVAVKRSHKSQKSKDYFSEFVKTTEG